MNETIDNETLLKTLSENPDAAHFLADLAAGGDLHQLIEAHFGITLSAPAPASENSENSETSEPSENSEHSETSPAPAHETGMYQSDIIPERRQADSTPTFLAHIRPDFWGDL
jgi:hypothetical protein